MRMLTRAERWLIARAHARHALRDLVPREFDPDEPRDDEGKWTDDGGDGGGDGDREHPGAGYSKAAYVKDGVIHTSNVHDAARALSENRKVELKQPKQVSTLIHELGKLAKAAERAGKTAPTFNLCNVTVEDTNLFCAESKGIPRVQMPQLTKEQTKEFLKHLEKEGYKVKRGKEDAANLRATQDELNGAKVAATIEKMRKDPDVRRRRMVISSDDYILDGHHHWAADIGIDAADNVLRDDKRVRIARVNIPIIKLLKEAEKFTGGKGHKPASEAKEFDPNEPRDDQGRWTDGGGSDGAPAAGAPYSSTVPSPDKGAGDVKAIYRPTAQTKSDFTHHGVDITPLNFYELKSQGAWRFHDAIKAAKEASPYGAAVELHDPAAYATMRTFLTPDHKVGFALNDNNIVSVFKKPDSTAKSAAGSALTLATQLGGRRLDAFDTVLPRLYSEAGFRAVARLPFNDKYAPPGWDREKFAAYNGGRPDVVFMVYDPQHPHEYVPGEGERVETYEAGEAAQQTALRALDDAHAAAQPAAPAAEKPAPSPTTAMTQIELWPDKFPPLPPPKSDLKLTDFNKEVTVDNGTRTDPKKAGKFLETWNTYVHEAPEAFRNEFLGGLPGTMNINYQWDESGGDDVQNEMSMSGNLLDKDGNKIGSYTRSIDFLNNKASSDYFSLNGREQGKNVGKQMLAANVAMYQKLGLDEVNVHADIDVGGYAWAKYGYVPTEDSWSDLQNTLLDKAGGGSYEPSSWEEMSSDQQDKVRDAWKRDTFDEFQQSEEDNWRDNGGDLHQAKENLTQALTDAKEPPPWFSHALDTLRAGKPDPIPFSDQQLLDSLSVGDYEDRHDDGRADPDITIDETALPEADRAKLTDDMRSDIEGALISAFNDQADKDRSDVDAPDFSDSIGDYQNDVWESMRDRDKFSYASDHGLLGSSESDIDVEPEVRALIEDSDPKAVWAIADSDRGKELLKGTDWYGKLDLHDGETMERFNAYVGKAKAK